MKLWRWFRNRRRKAWYLKQDIRVMQGNLVIWDSDKHEWVPLLTGLPYAFGKIGCTLVYMEGIEDLMFALFVRENPMDYFAKTVTHPIMIFYTTDKGFWREDYHDMLNLRKRIGDLNYDFLLSKAAINWNTTIIQ